MDNALDDHLLQLLHQHQGCWPIGKFFMWYGLFMVFTESFTTEAAFCNKQLCSECLILFTAATVNVTEKFLFACEVLLRTHDHYSLLRCKQTVPEHVSHVGKSSAPQRKS